MARWDRRVLPLTVEGDVIFTPKLKIEAVDLSPARPWLHRACRRQLRVLL